MREFLWILLVYSLLVVVGSVGNIRVDRAFPKHGEIIVASSCDQDDDLCRDLDRRDPVLSQQT
jgi:hypothetical protein